MRYGQHPNIITLKDVGTFVSYFVTKYTINKHRYREFIGAYKLFLHSKIYVLICLYNNCFFLNCLDTDIFCLMNVK